MKFRTKLMMFTAAIALSAGMATAAAITTNDVLAMYQTYTWVEIKEGPTQIKVEAGKDGMTIEVIYDKESGAVIKTETSSADADEISRTGIEIKVVDTDFGDDEDGDDSDDDSDDGDDSDDSDDSGDSDDSDDSDDGDDSGDSDDSDDGDEDDSDDDGDDDSSDD